MPAQQRGRRDEEGGPALPAQQPGQRGEQCPVHRRVMWPRHVTAEHGQLVAEHCDLKVLLVGRGAEPEKVEEAPDDQEGDLTGHPDDPGTPRHPLLRQQI